jgi:hypothetical protein
MTTENTLSTNHSRNSSLSGGSPFFDFPMRRSGWLAASTFDKLAVKHRDKHGIAPEDIVYQKGFNPAQVLIDVAKSERKLAVKALGCQLAKALVQWCGAGSRRQGRRHSGELSRGAAAFPHHLPSEQLFRIADHRFCCQRDGAIAEEARAAPPCAPVARATRRRPHVSRHGRQ